MCKLNTFVKMVLRIHQEFERIVVWKNLSDPLFKSGYLFRAVLCRLKVTILMFLYKYMAYEACRCIGIIHLLCRNCVQIHSDNIDSLSLSLSRTHARAPSLSRTRSLSKGLQLSLLRKRDSLFPFFSKIVLNHAFTFCSNFDVVLILRNIGGAPVFCVWYACESVSE